MKRLLYIASVMLAAFLLPLNASSAFAFRNIAEGDKAPDFALLSVDGQSVSLSSYSGKVVVLILWSADTESKEQRASELLSAVQSVVRKYGDKGLAALSVNFDKDGRDRAAAIAKKAGASFPTLMDEQGVVYGTYGVFILPTVGIIGKDGRLQKAYGYTRDIERMLEGEVEVLLGLKTKEEAEKELIRLEVVEKPQELKDADRHLNLGRVLLERRLPDQARQEFEKAAELDPSNAETQIELGLLLIEAEKYDDAVIRLTQGLELDSKSAKAHSGLGLVYLRKNELDKAADELAWALEINPRDARTYYLLGTVHEKKGEKEKALEQYKKALKLVFED
ncbi:tetratricopeptide repeat protein [Candidatus Poribacteria bacterium]|nr:tetratricopeptide repeat protein [Candidatus Poribacteria bacterium]